MIIKCPACGANYGILNPNEGDVVQHGFDWDGCGALFTFQNGKGVPLTKQGRAVIATPKNKLIAEALLEQVRAAFWG